jgi:hypothetical protein
VSRLAAHRLAACKRAAAVHHTAVRRLGARGEAAAHMSRTAAAFLFSGVVFGMSVDESVPLMSIKKFVLCKLSRWPDVRKERT